MTPIDHESVPPLAERVSSLETSVKGLFAQLEDVKRTMADGFADIQSTLRASGRTNWSVIFAGVGLVVAVYAAAVRPIMADVSRIELDSKTLALAVVEQNKRLQAIEVQVMVNTAALKVITADLERIRNEGSPITDRRLSILEMRAGIRK